jgi:phage I-like protein
VNDGHPTDDKVAAGWIEDLDIRGDGLWMLNSWTARARRHILADELRYLSPTFSENATDRATGKPQGPTLFGAGLLNDPFLQELPRVAASAVPPPAPKANKGASMDAKELRTLLGLAADATDEDVKKHLAQRDEEVKQLKAKAEAAERLQLSSNEAAQKLSQAHEALKLQAEESKKLAARVDAMEKEKQEAAIVSLQRELVTAGKIVAASQEHVRTYALALGVDKAKEFFTALPTVVQTGEAGVAGKSTTGDETSAAQAKLDARIAELRKADGSLKYMDAHRLALSEAPELGKVLYSSATVHRPAS